MDAIGKLYRLKEGSVGPPERCSGAYIKRVQLPDGTMAWSIGADEYVDNALVTVKATLESKGMKLKGKASKPLPNGYRPEMDVSPDCNAVMTQRYQAYIGILRWALKLGRVDIVLEVSLMSSFNALPREGHLEALYHMFAYLAKADQHSIAFDASSPDLKPSSMVATDWTDFYGDVSEAKPPKMPKPRGNPVNTTCFVDANHAGNLY
jgi:hypothetical protein